MLLEGDQFLSRLTLMFDKSRTKGHVQLTMKRYDGRTKPVPRPERIAASGKAKGPSGKKQNPSQEHKSRSDSSSNDHTGEYMCLVRAVSKDKKISCVVHARDLNKFQLAYSNLLKSNMDGLKRQKKQKTKKATQ